MLPGNNVASCLTRLNSLSIGSEFSLLTTRESLYLLHLEWALLIECWTPDMGFEKHLISSMPSWTYNCISKDDCLPCPL